MKSKARYVIMYDKVYPDRTLFGQTLAAKDLAEAKKIKAMLKGGPNEDIRIYDMK
jgi:hypothetical protein